ncbi:hypothetical protein [Dyella telluris]|uniref:Uncharacterized protein n=1 Tax=Dyella telluris TaxID=2763498 RepID=A0A7G8Q4J5_9GAMM|nr:hypothetical protein [Dyella telluris]QNK01703.1 hypothetical protein H8F01_00540 [Dyella telluris]
MKHRILIIDDLSGSMKGLAEAMAKAAVEIVEFSKVVPRKPDYSVISLPKIHFNDQHKHPHRGKQRRNWNARRH